MEVGCLECPRASTFGRQPAPRLNNAPMAGTTLQPSHEPPCTRDKNRHPSHWRTVERKGREGGELYGEWSWPCWLTETPRTAKPTPHEWNTAQLCKCLKTDLWTWVLLELFVVNSFKLHLNALSSIPVFRPRILIRCKKKCWKFLDLKWLCPKSSHFN